MSQIARASLACAVALGLLAGCGGGGEGGDGEGLPTRSPGVSPTRTPASPTRSPIRSSGPTDEQSAEPTRGPTRVDSTRPPQQGTGTADAQTSAPADEPAAEQGQSDDESALTAVWWLLLAVVLAGGVLAWILIRRSRSRGAWQEQVRAAEADVAWLARELLPQLRRAGSLDRAAGGWQVTLPRVAAAEDRLTVLESSAPSDMARAHARALRDAVRQARARMERLATQGSADVWVLDVDDAIGVLEAALVHEQAAAR